MYRQLEVVILGLLPLLAGAYHSASDATLTSIRTPILRQEKEKRTKAQQKIDSQLLTAIYQMRGDAQSKGVPTEPVPLRKDRKGRVLIDVRVPVTKKVLARIQALKGKVISTSQRDESIIAYFSLNKLETLAAMPEVKFISPAAESTTNRQ